MGGPAVYEIEHVSRYSYPSPVRHCVLSLCLKPRDDDAQRLLSFDVATDPPAPITSETDFLGNTKQVLNIHREHQALEIVSRSTVERRQVGLLPASLVAGAWQEIYAWRESFSQWEFTRPSAVARPSPALAAFVDELGIRPEDDPLDTVLRLSDALHRSFQYLPGSTSAVSPVEDILASRQGVCQDYAHVMIAIARSWGIPARYVSGYMYLDGSGGDGEWQTATHAWVECRLPGLDWTGFDPTNRCLADERHVRIGVGRDYQDVAPVRGVFVGVAEPRLEVKVRVRRKETAREQ